MDTRQAITPELREWLLAQVVVGHSADRVLASMQASGWDTSVALDAIREVMPGAKCGNGHCPVLSLCPYCQTPGLTFLWTKRRGKGAFLVTMADVILPKTISVFREGYGISRLKVDALAGLTVAIVALPLSMAIAIASGVTPDRGLYTAIIGGFLVSLLGGSRHQIGGPAGVARRIGGPASVVCECRDSCCGVPDMVVVD